MTPTPESQAALDILRIWPEEFKWYLIPLFALVVYLYAVEIEKKNWNRVFAGLAFWGMDWFNEIWNALILFITDYQAFWTCGGETGFLIFVGLNIEISMMFAMAGIAFTKMLPEDKNYKFDLTPLRIPLKIPNRWALAIGNSIFCVFVEVILNQANALLWVYDFWHATLLGIIPIVIFGYLHFMVVSFWVYDMKKRKNQIITLVVIYTVDILAIILFVGILGWI
ncbi:MAG: hypothetical protein KAT16_00120 [Candidatus Heimdallarchaeota archaeon]|nr:hypothetical protein [Candidatus Heimdallarchaeota archaeon]